MGCLLLPLYGEPFSQQHPVCQMVQAWKFANAYSSTLSIIRKYLYWYVLSHFGGSFAHICKPRARISIFHSNVKERCVAAVMLVVDVHNSPAELANIIVKQLDDFNYIYPRQSNVSPSYLRIGRSDLRRYTYHTGQYTHQLTTSQPSLSQPHHRCYYPRPVFHWTCSFCHSTPGPLPISPGTSWRTYS